MVLFLSVLFSSLIFAKAPTGSLAFDIEKNEMPLMAKKQELLFDLQASGKNLVDADFKSDPSVFGVFYDAGLAEFTIFPSSYDKKKKKWKSSVLLKRDGRYFIHVFPVRKNQTEPDFFSSSFSVYGGKGASPLPTTKKESLNAKASGYDGKLSVKKNKSGTHELELKVTSTKNKKLSEWKGEFQGAFLISSLSGEEFTPVFAKAAHEGFSLSGSVSGIAGIHRVWVIFSDGASEVPMSFFAKF